MSCATDRTASAAHLERVTEPVEAVASRRGLCTHGLPRQVRREETDRAAGQHGFEFSARLSDELAGERSRPNDCLAQVAKVLGVLDERLGVPVPLEDDALRLSSLKEISNCRVPVSLFRTISMACAARRLNSSSPSVELAPSDALKLAHGCTWLP